MTLRVTVNGKPREVPPGTTVLALLELLQLRPEGVAVAIAREVVPRGTHPTRILAEGDAVEILRAVGGG